MSDSSIACPKCRLSLNPAAYPLGAFRECSNCGAALQIETFPALGRPIAPGQAGQSIVVESEAGCFYHPSKQAVIHCAACGRFLCSLCDLGLSDGHYCPTCVETGRRKGKFSNLEDERFLYDELALTLAVAGLLTCGLTAPVSLYYALRHWKKPGGIASRSKATAIAAILLSLLQIGIFITWLAVVIWGD